MNRVKPIVLLGIAILIALITAFLVYGWMKSAASTARLKTKPVVVAVIDMPWGGVITKEKVAVKSFLEESIPPGTFSQVSEVEGRILKFPVSQNEPILTSRLAPAELKTGGVAAVVAAQKRAMAVKVDKVVGVSGFIHPGNRVDVFVTVREQRQNDVQTMTKLVLNNILVLAVGPQVEEPGKKEKPTQVDVITLEVTPEEGEKLALAATEGKVVLALRSFADNEAVKTRGTTIPALLSSSAEGAKPQAASRPASTRREGATPRIFTVELYQGSKLTQKTAERGE